MAGVYAAALTPLRADFAPDPPALPALLDFLARRGCHGALLLGTTGEGPSFAPEERRALWQAALAVRTAHPQFRLLAGAGTPSLEETIVLTRLAFDLGFDGVVALPPYYYRTVSIDGLYAWFSTVLQRAVPAGGALLGYHIPAVAGVGLPIELLARLKDAFPDRFAGLKDSSADPETARQLGARFGRDLLVLTGSDKLFTTALEAQAGGCITALANLEAPRLRQLWEAHHTGQATAELQAQLSARRAVLDHYLPLPPVLKALLARQHGFPLWPVRPPLLPLAPALADQAAQEFAALA